MNQVRTREAKPRYGVTADVLLDRKVTEIPSLLEPVFPKVGVIALGGSSDTGKSSFLRHFALSLVSGQEEFVGFTLKPIHRRVLYVSTEDDELAISHLLRKQIQNPNNPAPYRGLRFIFETERLFDKLDQELSVEPADCVIIDAFTDIFNGDLNASNKVRSFINVFTNIAKRHSCLFIFLHHTGKRTEYLAPSKNNLLGSQGFEAKMRMVMELRKDRTNPNLRHMCIVKGNYLPEEFKNQSFELEFSKEMLFKQTGKRTDFENLAIQSPARDERKPQMMELAKRLISEGNSCEKVSAILKEEHNYSAASSSTISNWTKDDS